MSVPGEHLARPDGETLPDRWGRHLRFLRDQLEKPPGNARLPDPESFVGEPAAGYDPVAAGTR
jgi:hypothetical protein